MRIKERELWQKYQKNLRELSKEIEQENPGWIKERRKNYLCKEIIRHCKYLVSFYEWYQEATQRGIPFIIKWIICKYAQYEKWERELKKVKGEYDYLCSGNGNGITMEKIQRAKEYPIAKLIEVNKQGFAHCPFHHPDKEPSFKIYSETNRYYCFGCQASGDVIDLYMKLHNVDFPQAVRKLQF